MVASLIWLRFKNGTSVKYMSIDTDMVGAYFFFLNVCLTTAPFWYGELFHQNSAFQL